MTWLAAISAFLAGFACGAAAIVYGFGWLMRLADRADEDHEADLSTPT